MILFVLPSLTGCRYGVVLSSSLSDISFSSPLDSIGLKPSKFSALFASGSQSSRAAQRSKGMMSHVNSDVPKTTIKGQASGYWKMDIGTTRTYTEGVGSWVWTPIVFLSARTSSCRVHVVYCATNLQHRMRIHTALRYS